MKPVGIQGIEGTPIVKDTSASGQKPAQIEVARVDNVSDVLDGLLDRAEQAGTLKKVSVARVQSSPNLSFTDEEIIRDCQESGNKWIERIAKELKLDPAKVLKLIPEIVSVDKALELKAAAMVPMLSSLPLGVLKGIIPKLPLDILKGLPEELVSKVLPREVIEQIKGAKFGDNVGGAYIFEIHKTGVAVHLVRAGFASASEFSAHEQNHALNALGRSFLTEEELAGAICKGLKDEITKGSTTVFSSIGFSELLYIPSSLMRQEIAQFLEETLLHLDSGRVKVEREEEGETHIENKKLTEQGKEELFNIAKRHSDFMDLFEDHDSAKLALSNLIETQLCRFDLVTGKLMPSFAMKITIPGQVFNGLPEQAKNEFREEFQGSEAAREFFKDSASNFLRLIEGNLKACLRIQSQSLPSVSEAIDYVLCPEESQCNFAGTVIEKDSASTPEYKIEMLQAREKIYEQGGLGEQYVSSLRELRTAQQDPSMVKESNKLHVAKIRYSESDRELRNLIKSDEISSLLKTDMRLEELIQKEAQLRTSANQMDLQRDICKIGTFIDDKYHEARKLLHDVRCEIRDTLTQMSPQSKLLERFSELLGKNDLELKQIKTLEASLDEKCLDPKNRVMDQALLDRVTELENRIGVEQQKARISTLAVKFPIEYSGRLISSETREISFDELPEDVKLQLKKNEGKEPWLE